MCMVRHHPRPPSPKMSLSPNSSWTVVSAVAQQLQFLFSCSTFAFYDPKWGGVFVRTHTHTPHQGCLPLVLALIIMLWDGNYLV